MFGTFFLVHHWSWAYTVQQYRSLTNLKFNPLYTCMIKIIFAAFLTPAHLILRLLFYPAAPSAIFLLLYKTYANTLQVLPGHTGLYR